jgi:RimJ/RimL family protein N-acetyltransferase
MNDSSWHDVVLADDKLRLRPIRELDWELIYKWCNDPEVLYFSDGPGVKGYDLDTIKNSIFEAGSRSRYCFVMEAEGEVIGECWLQKMNLARILKQYPSKDCRRIDLTIGEKQYWGKGYGTRAIRMLTEFGFSKENADMIFGCNIDSYNPRSLKAFQKNGYELHAENRHDDSSVTYDVCLTKGRYHRINCGST